MNKTKIQPSVVQMIKTPTAPLPTRRRMPKKVQRALLVFCIVSGLALPTDGALLILRIARLHTAHVAQYNQPILSFQKAALPSPGDATRTATNSIKHRNTSRPIFTLSSPNLTFNAFEGQSNLASQTETLSVGKQAFSWFIVPTSALPGWLNLSSMQGNTTTGVSATFEVSVHPERLTPGSYTTSLLVKAFTRQDQMLAGNPKTLLVTLVVSSACAASVTPTKLSFTIAPGTAPNLRTQTLSLTESLSCASPVKWLVRADVSWIRFSNQFATDSASSNSILVYISSFGLPPGSYTATITLRAIDSSGVSLVVSPTTIPVTLTITT